ncbi:MAG TPA: DUF2508 family protein [Thermoanaerobacterales bacterium]|nr:DUF2508 family protein [Thermoanaerobacterales bacterium]
MIENPDRNRKRWEDSFLEEIERARIEIELADKAFQWMKNDPEAVDAALSRMEASVEHYNYLIKQAKQLGISLDEKTLYSRLLKT